MAGGRAEIQAEIDVSIDHTHTHTHERRRAVHSRSVWSNLVKIRTSESKIQ